MKKVMYDIPIAHPHSLLIFTSFLRWRLLLSPKPPNCLKKLRYQRKLGSKLHGMEKCRYKYRSKNNGERAILHK